MSQSKIDTRLLIAALLAIMMILATLAACYVNRSAAKPMIQPTTTFVTE